MKKKILLIDDSQTQLISVKLYLLKAGYEVITANNGIDGISAAYQHMPDLVVSDIVMPEMNGYQLCRLLKNDDQTKDIPIILLTSLNEKLDKFWGLRAGANAFLNKDSNFDLLSQELDKHLNSASVNASLKTCNTSANECFEAHSVHSKLNDILDQALIESTIINEFRNLSEFILDSKVLYKGILSLLSSILDYDVAGIFFNDKDEKKDKLLSISCHDVDIESIQEALKDDFFSVILAEEFSSNKQLCHCEISAKAGKANKIQDLNYFRTKKIIPINFSGKVLGGICIYHTAKDKGCSSRILNIILEELKILMRIKWLYSETKLLAITDSLTGLYNRRYFQQSLEREFSRAKRYKTDLSVVMLDIDHFKKLNDTYGHQFGDKVLAEVSKIIKAGLRKTDYISRYGGEEFIAILPETGLERAYIPIERVRKSIEDQPFKFGDQDVKVTISIGIASINETITADQDLVKHADQALYSAKENGRNRVILYREGQNGE